MSSIQVNNDQYVRGVDIGFHDIYFVVVNFDPFYFDFGSFAPRTWELSLIVTLGLLLLTLEAPLGVGVMVWVLLL